MKLSRRTARIIFVIVVVIVIISVLNLFQKQTREFFYFISAPFQKVLKPAGDKALNFFKGFIRTGSLKNELDELKRKNQEFLAEVVSLRESEKENNVLRQALDIGLEKEFKLEMVQVISKDIFNDYILIDRGERDGIKKNMPVITSEKILAGRISEVYNKFSKVMLISEKKNSFDVDICQEEENICVVAKGKGNSKILLDLIPKDKELNTGDIVSTSALGGLFPKGLLVGRISEIKKSDVESHQKAEVDLFFEIGRINYLFVIIDY